MSTEQNQPDAPDFAGAPSGPKEGGSEASAAAGQNAGPGAGQGRFRRRRRRKKNSGGQNIQANAGQTQADAGATEGQAATGQNQGQTQGQSQDASAPRPQQGQQNQQAHGEAGQRRRRKKKGGKKFFQPGGQQAQPGNRQSHQPGNNFGGGGGGFSNGGGHRNKKGRGGRQFVGPMDHSYRAVNGNYAEAPPSTISVNGNHGRGYNHNAHMQDSGHQSQFLPTFYEPPPPPIREDAPVRVFCFIDDLFITAKITEAARKLGVKVAFVKGEKEDIARITEAPEGERAQLVIFDLNNANAKPFTLIPKIRTKLKKGVSIIGFLSYLQGDLKAKAAEAGCDSVMPRAAFSQALPNLLRRYGVEEEADGGDAQPAFLQ
jgi:hypothetical protein